MLEIKKLCTSYGKVQVLFDLDITVPDGEIVSIVGSNGAGKTTLLNTISAVVKKKSGNILWNGEALSESQYLIVKKGIVQVPEGRKVFSGLTVYENLMIGGYLYTAANNRENMERMFKYFPRLEQRRKQLAGTLSGGEQQMLAFARGLMSNPKLILLDEPSLGLAPIIVNQIFDMIKEINSMGISVLLVEQNAAKALKMCNYAYVLENGRIVLEDAPEELLKSEAVKKAYLGSA